MSGSRVLVTGASGMLGAAVADALAARGDDVTVLQRRASTRGHRHREVLADIADTAAVTAALTGHDAVVHLAAKVDITGRWADFARTNIHGTTVVMGACRAAGVGRLVHVSSPSVAHTGSALVGVGPEPADPRRARGHYARSKAAAELVALSGAGPHRPTVVAVRPHLVWGPGDTQLIGRIVGRARAGRLVGIGSGAALIDTTYVSNAADALVAALDRCDALDGRSLVVSNGEPRPIAELLTSICRATGVPGPRRSVPVGIARTAGALAETAWTLAPVLRRAGDPPITRFLAEQLSTAHWFDQRDTRSSLRWTPRVSLDDGFAALAATQRHHRETV